MKKIFITAGIISAITPVMGENIVFADNNSLIRSVESSFTATGKVTGVKSNDNLNIRKTSSATSTILGKVKGGTTLKIVGKASNGWYKVNHNGIVGYVSNKYVSLTSGQQITTGKKGIVDLSSSNLNIRKSATTSSSVVGKIPAKGSVNILSENKNGWYHVEYKGTKGYVSAKYIKVTNSTSSSNTSNSSVSNKNVGKIATVKTSSLNIRSGAGTNHSVIGRVYSNNKVKILAYNSNGWYNVELQSGVKGWCSGSYLGDFKDGSLNSTPNNTNKPANTNQSQNEKVQAVIKMAKAQLGKPYVWGAEGPNSFDCSGLTQYVYKNSIGVNIPRSSKTQGTFGKYVAKSDLQPGDLVFFDGKYGNNITHVGIYIGDNKMIHSPKPGDVVKIQSIAINHYIKGYVTARRII